MPLGFESRPTSAPLELRPPADWRCILRQSAGAASHTITLFEFPRGEYLPAWTRRLERTRRTKVRNNSLHGMSDSVMIQLSAIILESKLS